DFSDFFTFADCFGQSDPVANCDPEAFVKADFNRDKNVDINDFACFVEEFGLGTGPSGPVTQPECGFCDLTTDQACGDIDDDEFVGLQDFFTFADCFGRSAAGGPCTDNRFYKSDIDKANGIDHDDLACLVNELGTSGQQPECSVACTGTVPTGPGLIKSTVSIPAAPIDWYYFDYSQFGLIPPTDQMQVCDWTCNFDNAHRFGDGCLCNPGFKPSGSICVESNAPVISNLAVNRNPDFSGNVVTADQPHVVIALSTNEVARCKYALGSNPPFSSMTHFTAGGGGLTALHSNNIFVDDHGSYTAHIRCQDNLANEATTQID
ncbi:MAG: hypothetical protein QF704_16700, partial [Anaerolineales bacterium]|nr:hypothetical protein [Anaerolineales bacterium]